jgi:DNA topoisomerase-3
MRRNNYYKGRGGYYNKGGNRGGGYYGGGGRRRGGNRGYGYNQYDYYEDDYNNKNEKFVEVEISSSSKPLPKNTNQEIEKSSSNQNKEKEIEISSKNNKSKFQEDIEDDTFDDTYESGNYDPNENYDENDNYDDYDYDYGYDYGQPDDNNDYNDYNYSKSNNSKTYQSNPKYDKMTFTNESGFTEMVDKSINYNKNDYISDNFVNVLMIAEKPSIARAISEVLSGNKFKNHRMGRGKCLLTFDGFFQGAKARFTVSAVAGHVYTSDFLKQHNKWDAIDPVELYDVPIVKLEAMRKMRMPQLIQKLSKGKDILCLWLDCDSEGENICYEVIYNSLPYLNKKSYQQIFRAKFSSLTKKDLREAFDKISDYADKNVSLSVDARQVIDLKIGVSFTRFLTSSIMPALSGLDESYKMLSYGPCQTPTLWFCVNRQNEIKNFRSTPYYKLYIEVEINKFRYKIFYDKKFKKKSEFNDILEKLKKVKEIKIKEIIKEQNTKTPPVGLNTATLLKIASSFLKMSPHETMSVAESLYTKGFITYPRTETTKYAVLWTMPNTDFMVLC